MRIFWHLIAALSATLRPDEAIGMHAFTELRPVGLYSATTQSDCSVDTAISLYFVVFLTRRINIGKYTD